MVADQQQERNLTRKLPCASDRVSVAKRRGLFDEPQPPTVSARSGGVSRLISRADDHADLLDAG